MSSLLNSESILDLRGLELVELHLQGGAICASCFPGRGHATA